MARFKLKKKILTNEYCQQIIDFKGSHVGGQEVSKRHVTGFYCFLFFIHTHTNYLLTRPYTHIN